MFPPGASQRRQPEAQFQEIGRVSPGMFESGPAAYNRPAPGNTRTSWDESLQGQWLPTAAWQPGAKEPDRRTLAESRLGSREAVQLHRAEYYAHTADHGLAVGRHGLMGKQNLYDHSIRIPRLSSGPGIPADKRVDEMVDQHSLFATTCDLAAVTAPKTPEFPSLSDLLKGRGREKHDASFSHCRNFQRAVRLSDELRRLQRELEDDLPASGNLQFRPLR